LIHTTLAAMPRRSVVLAAKAVLGSLLAGRLILPGNGFTVAHGYPPLSLADGPTLRAATGSVLYLALVALLSLLIFACFFCTEGVDQATSWSWCALVTVSPGLTALALHAGMNATPNATAPARIKRFMPLPRFLT
jgi:hypothetical protein